jgi:transcriptional regulator GlxA family with amidase domain
MDPMPDEILREQVRARPLGVGILLFPDVEVLDFAGPFEVFSVAARIHFAAHGHPPFDIATIAKARGPLRARHGLTVVPSFTFADAPKLDLLIVPGGVMTQPLGDDATLRFV